MQLSLTKYLILSSLFALASCSVPKALIPLKNGIKKKLTAQDFVSPFNNNFESLVFKTNLSYGDKFDLGGLLALKQLSKGNYRTVFMTMAGSTLFDFEFGENGFVVHKTLKALDKKILLKIIEQDFSLLLAKDLLQSEGLVFSESKNTVIKSKHYKKTYFEIDRETLQPIKTYKGRRITVSILDYNNKTPQNIEIIHHKLPLKMKLKLIKH